ncbi:MAG: hypothetical protein WBE91_02890 [Steroidobacteraceae bacterium]
MALLASKVELRDRTGWQLREEPFEALEDVESSQYTNERNEFDAEARLDTLDGALADAGSLGELGLGQACFDAISRNPLTQDLGDGGIRKLWCDTHKSPLMATKLKRGVQIAVHDELYLVNISDATRRIRRIELAATIYSPNIANCFV